MEISYAPGRRKSHSDIQDSSEFTRIPLRPHLIAVQLKPQALCVSVDAGMLKSEPVRHPRLLGAVMRYSDGGSQPKAIDGYERPKSTSLNP